MRALRPAIFLLHAREVSYDAGNNLSRLDASEGARSRILNVVTVGTMARSAASQTAGGCHVLRLALGSRRRRLQRVVAVVRQIY